MTKTSMPRYERKNCPDCRGTGQRHAGPGGHRPCHVCRPMSQQEKHEEIKRTSREFKIFMKHNRTMIPISMLEDLQDFLAREHVRARERILGFACDHVDRFPTE